MMATSSSLVGVRDWLRYIDAARGKRPDPAPEPALPEFVELPRKKPAKRRA
jgi:uncharacterized short protein YbdD (DUF466 family)